MPTDSERLEVESVIRDSIGRVLTKNLDRLFSIMAQEEDLFISHPDTQSAVVGLKLSRSWANGFG